jgi:UDP-N-acetylglucosamine 2-epimerase
MAVFDEMQALLDDPQAYRRMSRVENPYGDGFASRRIAARLVADRDVSLARLFGPRSPAEG